MDNIEDENKVQVSDLSKGLLPPRFDIQLVDALPVEIVARRFPVAASEGRNWDPAVNFSLENRQVNEETHLAEVILTVKVNFPTDPQLFEISFGILGIFAYAPTCSSETVYSYLEQGPLSILLPFARELLASLCMRIRVPLLYIPMYPIASSESQTEELQDS